MRAKAYCAYFTLRDIRRWGVSAAVSVKWAGCTSVVNRSFEHHSRHYDLGWFHPNVVREHPGDGQEPNISLFCPQPHERTCGVKAILSTHSGTFCYKYPYFLRDSKLYPTAQHSVSLTTVPDWPSIRYSEPLRHGGTLNSLQAASPLVKLVEGALHPQGALLQN
ncbi:hypothetical protein TNCV_4804271 [Trichonephila clavipes]|nr:hypothetical protein TNCV_4804271 [Trichonephila clavipes]